MLTSATQQTEQCSVTADISDDHSLHQYYPWSPLYTDFGNNLTMNTYTQPHRNQAYGKCWSPGANPNPNANLVSWNKLGRCCKSKQAFWPNSLSLHVRKLNFTNRVIPVWNSLPNYVVSAHTINTFKNRLDKFWCDQEVLYHYNTDLHGIGNRSLLTLL